MTGRDNDPEARYRAVQARMDARAAQRHAARQDAANALASARLRPASPAEFDALLARVAEATTRASQIREVSPPAETPITESEQDKPLHQMDLAEFREHARGVWAQHAETMQSPVWQDRTPMTLGEYIARGRE